MLGDKRAIRLLEHRAVSIIGQYKCWPTEKCEHWDDYVIEERNKLSFSAHHAGSVLLCGNNEIWKKTGATKQSAKSCCRQQEQARSLLTIFPSIGENSSVPVVFYHTCEGDLWKGLAAGMLISKSIKSLIDLQWNLQLKYSISLYPPIRLLLFISDWIFPPNQPNHSKLEGYSLTGT